MEAMVEIGVVLLIVIIVLLFIITNLKNDKEELKESLRKREELIKKELNALECCGQYYVDCDANPLDIKGFTVVSHKQTGLWKFNPYPNFYLSEKQKDKNNETHGTIKGCDLYQELVNQNIANANILDFLLAHPQLISETWLLPLPFWGTVYRDNKTGQCFVRCLIHYLDGEYGDTMHWLGAYLNANEPAILVE
jgi:hypothetical protein